MLLGYIAGIFKIERYRKSERGGRGNGNDSRAEIEKEIIQNSWPWGG